MTKGEKAIAILVQEHAERMDEIEDKVGDIEWRSRWPRRAAKRVAKGLILASAALATGGAFACGVALALAVVGR